MQRIVTFGMILLAGLAIAGAGAVSVSASNDEFVASKLGKTKSKGTSALQKFKTSAGTIECTEASGTGEIKALSSTTHKEEVTFGGCTGFGNNVKITTADFEYEANGPAKLENKVTIQPEGVSCHVVIEPQSFESLSYENVSIGKLKSAASISKVKYKGTGGVCGGEGEGSYGGTIQAELEGGTLEWKS
jgi:hypothetical protein